MTTMTLSHLKSHRSIRKSKNNTQCKVDFVVKWLLVLDVDHVSGVDKSCRLVSTTVTHLIRSWSASKRISWPNSLQTTYLVIPNNGKDHFQSSSPFMNIIWQQLSYEVNFSFSPHNRQHVFPTCIAHYVCVFLSTRSSNLVSYGMATMIVSAKPLR